MKIKYIALTAVFSTFLVGCGSSGGGSGSGGGGVITPSSIDGVPSEYRDAVRKAKTFNPLSIVQSDLAYEGVDITQITIDGEKSTSGEFDFSKLADGLNSLNFEFDFGAYGQTLGTATGQLTIYQQPYSVVTGSDFYSIAGIDTTSESIHYVDGVRGLSTTNDGIAQLANEGAFTYKGAAFNGHETGSLSYTVDFGTKEGSGMITGISETGNITMEKASIANLNNEVVQGLGIEGKAVFQKDPTITGNYELGFFGPKAEEIAGRVSDENDWYSELNEIGFGGRR